MDRLLCIALILLACACRAPQCMATVLAPGARIELELTGDRPRLVVHNRGPGYLTLQASGKGFASTKTFGPGTVTQDFPGPTRVELRATSEEPVRLSFESIQGASLAWAVRYGQ